MVGARRERRHFQQRLYDEHHEDEVVAQLKQVAVLGDHRGGGLQAQNYRVEQNQQDD